MTAKAAHIVVGFFVRGELRSIHSRDTLEGVINEAETCAADEVRILGSADIQTGKLQSYSPPLVMWRSGNGPMHIKLC
jgi:hypothetical protein